LFAVRRCQIAEKKALGPHASNGLPAHGAQAAVGPSMHQRRQNRRPTCAPFVPFLPIHFPLGSQPERAEPVTRAPSAGLARNRPSRHRPMSPLLLPECAQTN
jgi:hypothetical protein